MPESPRLYSPMNGEIRGQNALLCARTVNGRPLFESLAPKDFLSSLQASGVPLQLDANRYDDSRIIPPNPVINTSALHEMQQGMPAMLDGFSWMHRLVRRVQGNEITDTEMLLDVTTIGENLPGYLLFKKDRPTYYQSLPDVVGDIAKASQGLRTTALLMDQPTVTGRDVYRYADEHGFLIGRETDTDQTVVCAAPKGLIIATAHTALTGDGGTPERSDLNSIVDNGDTLYAYAKNMLVLTECSSYIRQQALEFSQEVAATGDYETPSFNASFNTFAETQVAMMDDVIHATEGGFTALGYDTSEIAIPTYRSLYLEVYRGYVVDDQNRPISPLTDKRMSDYLLSR